MKKQYDLDKFLEQRKKHYLNGNSDKCLYCDNTNIWEVCYTFNRPDLYLCTVRCDDCNGEWEEQYKLSKVKPESYFEDKIKPVSTS